MSRRKALVCTLLPAHTLTDGGRDIERTATSATEQHGHQCLVHRLLLVSPRACPRSSFHSQQSVHHGSSKSSQRSGHQRLPSGSITEESSPNMPNLLALTASPTLTPPLPDTCLWKRPAMKDSILILGTNPPRPGRGISIRGNKKKSFHPSHSNRKSLPPTALPLKPPPTLKDPHQMDLIFHQNHGMV